MGRRGRTNLSEEHFFFVTSSVVRFLQIFQDEKVCDILINNLKYYREKYLYNILAYVIMPSHFHWIIELNTERGTISDIMRDVKKYSAWDIMDYLKENKFTEVFKYEALEINDQNRKLWMSRFDDEVIRNQRMLWTKIKYIHSNPVKAGIVDRPEDYKYSSARNYIHGNHSIITVDTETAGVEII
jgi:putative transposase